MIQKKYKNIIELCELAPDKIAITVQGSFFHIINRESDIRISGNVRITNYPHQCGVLIISGLHYHVYSDNREALKIELANMLLDISTILAIRCGHSQLRYTASTKDQKKLIDILLSKRWYIADKLTFINSRTGKEIITLFKNILFVEHENLGEVLNG